MNGLIERLFDKCADGNIDAIKLMIENGGSIDYQNINGETALLAAVKKNNLESVKVLIKNGANPNIRDNTMLTPYLCAGANGFHEILEYLILNGADIKHTNRFGGTALIPASEKGFFKAVEICLKYNINVNHKNDLGWSALEEAVILGDGGILYTDIIRILVKAGADTEATDNLGISVKSHAKNQPAVLSLLNGTEIIRPWDDILNNAKKNAFDNNYTEALNIILENSCNLPEELYSYYSGYYYSLLKDYEKALGCFMAAAENHSEFLFYTANCLRLMDKKTDALNAFDKGISKSNKPEFFRYHKTNYLRELGLHAEAIFETDELLKENPNRYDYYFHKANSQRSLGLHIQAVTTVEKAVNIDSQNALYHHHMAKSYELASQFDKAAACYEKAIERLDRPSYRMDLENCLCQAGK